MRYLIVLLLAGCATQQGVTLYPRGTGGLEGKGSIDRMSNELVVQVGSETYRGKNEFASVLGKDDNKASALLYGSTGRMRCDYAWNSPWLTEATGVCTNSTTGAVYDLQIK